MHSFIHSSMIIYVFAVSMGFMLAVWGVDSNSPHGFKGPGPRPRHPRHLEHEVGVTERSTQTAWPRCAVSAVSVPSVNK